MSSLWISLCLLTQMFPVLLKSFTPSTPPLASGLASFFTKISRPILWEFPQLLLLCPAFIIPPGVRMFPLQHKSLQCISCLAHSCLPKDAALFTNHHVFLVPSPSRSLSPLPGNMLQSLLPRKIKIKSLFCFLPLVIILYFPSLKNSKLGEPSMMRNFKMARILRGLVKERPRGQESCLWRFTLHRCNIYRW